MTYQLTHEPGYDADIMYYVGPSMCEVDERADQTLIY